MTRQEANAILCAILCAADSTPGGAPEGVMYAALMNRCDLPTFRAVLDIARGAGLVTSSGFVVRTTPKGHDMVQSIEAAMRKAGAAL